MRHAVDRRAQRSARTIGRTERGVRWASKRGSARRRSRRAIASGASKTHWIDPIPESDRHGTPKELFWIWCAANIAILGVAYGGFIAEKRKIRKGILAAPTGTTVSFLLVRFISLAGMLGSAPTLVLSAVSSGVAGNAIPTAISYISLVGWETILVALATLSAETIADRLGPPLGKPTLAVAFAVIAARDHRRRPARPRDHREDPDAVYTCFRCHDRDLHGARGVEHRLAQGVDAATGKFFGGLVGGTSILMAGLGIGWVNAGADYSRYLPANVEPSFGGGLDDFRRQRRADHPDRVWRSAYRRQQRHRFLDQPIGVSRRTCRRGSGCHTC